MDKNYFIKISAVIFILLAVIISLFPPFEFSRRNISPVKKYDFIFSTNKKNIILDYHNFQKKFYRLDTLAYYKALWKDAKFSFYRISVDTFYTARKFLFKKHTESKRPKWSGEKWNPEIEQKSYTKVRYNDNVEDAVNYNKVKNKYLNSPNNWDFKYITQYDSAKKYDEYNISKPIYYSLSRKMLLGELLVEYILACLISISVGYLISRLRFRKSV